ncbi:MAG: N-6 DNA methylase [Flavobacteriales bacterium]|nr:N-6 DNA methylase [Flavobacteriales bacterium]
MPLFQTSVLKTHLKQQDQALIEKAYKKFIKYFQDPSIQDNIRNSKEEQFQEGFLRELFVRVFGYVINPSVNYNLTTEFKNEKGSKKADGAILHPDRSSEGKALAVIELKGTDTKDLEKIRQQAFDYKANQTACVYVITSNFEKLRFYIDHAVDYEEFDLFNLNLERFKLLYLCLDQSNLLNNVPLKIKETSIREEEAITKKFYSDYSQFKRELFRDLVKLNVKNEVFREELNKTDADRAVKNIKQTLFKKSQKLIDRFLFIFFAEDRDLLPPNSTLKILEQWDKLKELDEIVPLYSRFKKYFNYLDEGRKGTDKTAEIFAYNGGLFKPDAILDSIIISDELLYKHAETLSLYDFESQVDVNILGHIFENSLNEIESINAEIEGLDFEKQKTKRKKDGVFYTPKYITKYIVDHTVGKLCEEKKKELNLVEEEYHKNRKGRTKKKLMDLTEILDKYRTWLLNITICDPACGSGAFLNQALDFLIKEHTYLDELQTNLLGGGFLFPNIENTILENNIYGVDINEESVEIAKLSLWLRTAQPRRKLNDLNNNIKCGNSLIDSKAVAGDKAFNWNEEFPEIFAKGGFDVVIGNPPYVRQELVKHYVEALKQYEVFSGKGDLYTYFYEKGYNILKEGGLLSFISSGKFFEASYGKPLVKYLVKNLVIEEIINFDDLEVFEGISAYPLIFTGRKNELKQEYSFNYCYVPKFNFSSIIDIVSNLPFTKIYISDFVDFGYNFFTKEVAKIFKKINTNSHYLPDFELSPLVGIKTGFNEGFTTTHNFQNSKPYIFGKNLKKYLPPQSETNIIFPYCREEDQYILLENSQLKTEEKQHFELNREKLEKRAVISEGLKNNTKKWYEYQQINKKLNFDSAYIVFPNVSLGPNFTISKGNVIDMTGFIIPTDDQYLLTILNSKICDFVMKNIAITRRGGYQEYKVQYLERVPIKKLEEKEKTTFIQRSKSRILLTYSIFKYFESFQKYLQSQFPIEKLPKKLENWHELEFGEFITELNKAIKKAGGNPLSKLQEMEWMEVFETKKAEAQALKTEIDKTDKEIDQMVYELYGLTEEEIKIVENS